MWHDVITVMWKEWKELLEQRWVFWGMFSQAGTFGVFLAIHQGIAFVNSPVSLSYWVWLPSIMVMTVIADAFAGERERHTLESLLATRLPSTAIVLGKLGTAVGYALAITATAVGVGVLVVNIQYSTGMPILISPFFGLFGACLSLLMAILVGSAGILISMRATTVRQAQLTIAMIFVPLTIIPASILLELPGPLRTLLSGQPVNLPITEIAVIVGTIVGILITADIVLLIIALRRFRRSEVVLES